jgi:hypothetical protein
VRPLAAFLLGVSLLSGCTGDDTPVPNPTDAGASDAPATTQDAASGADATADASSTSGVKWKQDGVQNDATGSAESLVSANAPIGFALNAFDAVLGNNISLNVFVSTTAEWKPGTYACPTAASVGYVNKNGSYTMMSCSFTVTDIGTVGGANLKGTFTATLTKPGGGTTTLSDGTIDVPYMKK